MIQGLHFDVQSEELKDIISRQITKHVAKAKEYAGQLERLSGLETSGGSMDPKKDLEGHRTHHENSVKTLTFLRDHVVPNETYRLSESDLATIGLVSRPW